MTKTIDTLVEDIERDVLGPTDCPVSEEAAASLGKELGDIVRDRLSNKTRTPMLRVSNLGTRCKRKLWYAINTPEDAEPLSAAARLKFLYGDIIERLVLFFAGLAGHRVTREQEEVTVQGVKGHLDAFIDDHLVDVKSASTASFRKFASGGLRDDDTWGYITQLSSYGEGTGETEGSFIAVDKQLGHICRDTHTLEQLPSDLADTTRAFLAREEPPARAFSDEKDGESGNRKLGLACSYCEFKHKCWPNLQVYPYANGPRFLTVVAREPRPWASRGKATKGR